MDASYRGNIPDLLTEAGRSAVYRRALAAWHRGTRDTAKILRITRALVNGTRFRRGYEKRTRKPAPRLQAPYYSLATARSPGLRVKCRPVSHDDEPGWTTLVEPIWLNESG
jgi:hypothetical protein